MKSRRGYVIMQKTQKMGQNFESFCLYETTLSRSASNKVFQIYKDTLFSTSGICMFHTLKG